MTNTPPAHRECLDGITDSDAVEEVDLTHEGAGERLTLRLRPYTPQRDRERKRGWLAYSLVGLVALNVLGAFGLVVAGFDIAIIEKLLTYTFTPIMTLTGGGVMAFYFGGRTVSG